MKKRTFKSDIVVEGLLGYLVETGKEDLLPEVTEALKDVVYKKEKATEIVVVSAVSLTSDQMRRLNMVLTKLLKVNLPVVNKIDKNILGGFTIQVGDWFLDSSLVRQIEHLKQAMFS